MLIHPSCQFDFSEIRDDLNFRCKQCGGEYQSFTRNCSKYNDELAKYLENKLGNSSNTSKVYKITCP